MEASNSDDGRGRRLGIASIASLAIGSLVALFLVPADARQGEVQRLMYIHVPTAWLAFLAFFVVFVMSVLYLVQRRQRWDLVAASSAEIGVLFTALTLVQGSLWAFGTWGGRGWALDPRIVTTVILLLIYAGYLMVRSLAEEPEQRARWAAAVGIVGFVQVPIVYLSVYWWRSVHQPASSPRSVAPEFLAVLLFNVFAFTLLFFYLLGRRLRLAEAEHALFLEGPDDD